MNVCAAKPGQLRMFSDGSIVVVLEHDDSTGTKIPIGSWLLYDCASGTNTWVYDGKHNMGFEALIHTELLVDV